VKKYGAIRQQLLARRKELNSRINKITSTARHIDEPLTPDFSEQAVERQNDEVLAALGDAGRCELAQINRALAHIEAGEYGVCDSCGKTILPARLEILPYSDLCVACAEKQGAA
jgi:DnaK suppressor protein